jgi:hypothetical protein
LRGSGSLPWNLYLVGEIYREYLPADLASKICTDLSTFLASSVICSNERTRFLFFLGTGYVVGEYSLGGDVSNSPPSFFQAGNPPSRTETASCPNTLNVHHTLGDENMPWVS